AATLGVNYGMLGDNLPTPDKAYANTPRQVQVSHTLEMYGGEYIEHHTPVRCFFARVWENLNNIPLCWRCSNTWNIDAALKAAHLGVTVTTVVSMQALGNSYPPSEGAFADLSIMGPITDFLQTNGYPLTVNVYSYFTHAQDVVNITLNYALFMSDNVVVKDGKNGELGYQNLFDAMVDAVYSALENAGGFNVDVVVTETGWPSAGNVDARIDFAQTYINNLFAHLRSGKRAPKKPGKDLETYIFAMFNENLKPAGVEQNFGLYYPEITTPVYHVNL
ncbi:hypothetical protein GIB67_017545, partial [Kingdonia uniflora]